MPCKDEETVGPYRMILFKVLWSHSVPVPLPPVSESVSASQLCLCKAVAFV